MLLKHVAILLVIVAACSAGVTRYYYPSVEYKDKEVIKETVRNDIRTVVKEVTKADGTKEVITETTDKSIKKESQNREIQIAAKSQWLFGLSAIKKFSEPEIGAEIMIAKRQFGPFYLMGKLGHIKNETSGSIGIVMEY